MAVRPEIGLQGRITDIGQSFSNALLGINRIQGIKQGITEAPLRARILDAQAQSTEAGVPSEQSISNQRQSEIIKSLGVGAQQIIPDLERGNIDLVVSNLESRRNDLIEQQKTNPNITTEETDEAIRLAKTNPDELLTRSQQAVQLASQLTPSGKTQFGGQQTFKDTKGNLFFGTTKRNPTDGSVQSVLAPIAGGPAQPIGQVSLVSQLGQTAVEKQETLIDTERQKQQVKGDIQTEQEVEKAQRIETETATSRQSLEAGKIRLDETKAKNAEQRKQIIDSKNIRRVEALAAVDQVNGLLKDDKFADAFGKVVTATPPLLRSQSAIDSRAEVDQIIGLLSLESRQKLKGQGTITDSEAKTLEKSATVLADPLISDELARKEFIKVRGIFESSAARNQLKKETRQELQADQLSPEDQAELEQLRALKAQQNGR